MLGAAHALTHHFNISQMPDLTVTAAAQSGPLAMERAGITVDDVDVLQVYDSFTITVLLSLEDLGFCKKGDGGPFVEDGRLRWDGPLPTNTDGGGLSACHPGMRGMFLIVEAVRQLRGEGTGPPGRGRRGRAVPRNRRHALDRRHPRASEGQAMSERSEDGGRATAREPGRSTPMGFGGAAPAKS